MWDTGEVRHLIQWMRTYNADPAHTRKVKFFCMDVAYSKTAADHVVEYLEKVDKTFAKEAVKTLTVLRQTNVYNVLYKYKESQSDTLKKGLAELLERFDSKKEAFVTASSKKEWAWNRQHTRYLQHFLDYALAGNTNDYRAIDVRDRTMAGTVKWILDNEPPGTRIALWAHNFHISAAPYPGFPFTFLGMHLRKMLGNDYLAVGFVFNRGGFQSFDLTASRTPFLLKGFTIKPYPGSYGTAMARTGIPLFFLDLRR
ncbi:MAG: erythromycin esterase family protein, partial [bacterium]|nr:erythromycin esterase family protein [bacterium]